MKKALLKNNTKNNFIDEKYSFGENTSFCDDVNHILQSITAPPSKSYLHRFMIAASLSCHAKQQRDNGELLSNRKSIKKQQAQEPNNYRANFEEIENLLSKGHFPISDDIIATKNGIFELLSGEKNITIDCGESGSTLRFLMPLAAIMGINTRFILHGKLASRPNDELKGELTKNGCNITRPADNVIELSGSLKEGKFIFHNPSSSQFISGLLLALPVAKFDLSEIKIYGEIQSAPYIDMTLEILKNFGITISANFGFYKAENDKIISPLNNASKTSSFSGEHAIPCTLSISGNQIYRKPEGIIKIETTPMFEGDWSNAAALISIGALGKTPLLIKGLRKDSAQGDREIIKIMRDFGVSLNITTTPAIDKFINLIVYPSRDKLKAIKKIDISQIPDLAPIISLMASIAKGTTIIASTKRLRYKESNREESIANSLNLIGADIKIVNDRLIIKGQTSLTGAYRGNCYFDHRIIMMMAAASLVTEELVSISNYEAVNKSYPGFFDELTRLGYMENIELI